MTNHGMYLNSSDLELVTDGATLQTVGMRFANISVPKGATITNAYITFTVDEAQSGITSLSFYGQAIDNAPAFTSAASNVTGRVKTISKTDWNNIPAWTTIGAKIQTPNISSVIQEIVNRTGWLPNNSLAIIGTGSGRRTAKAFDNGAANAPVLTITYTTK
jgi:hypothetical protein